LHNLNNQTGVEFFFTELECKYIEMFVTVAGHFNNKVSLSTGKLKSVAAKIWLYFVLM